MLRALELKVCEWHCEYDWCRKHYELGEFVPRSLLSSVERSCRGGLLTCQASYEHRSLRRRLSELINETRCARNKAGKPLTSAQIKLHYLRVISQLPSYGTRCFLVSTVTYYFIQQEAQLPQRDSPSTTHVILGSVTERALH